MRRAISHKVLAVVALCIVGVVVGTFSLRRDIAIAFHRHVMFSDWVAEGRLGPHELDYLRAVEYHRDALTRLGYLQRFEFTLQHIEADTPRDRDLSQVLYHRTPHVPDAFIMTITPPPPKRMPRKVIVWARPDLQARFATIISNLDMTTNTQPNTALEPTPTAP